jgi:hypothetical protein
VSVSPVTPARITARPVTPNVRQATAVKTIAAEPSSSPPRMNSTFWTVRVVVSGAAGIGAGAMGAAGATGPGAQAGVAARRRTRSSRRALAAFSVANRAAQAWRACSVCPSSTAIS